MTAPRKKPDFGHLMTLTGTVAYLARQTDVQSEYPVRILLDRVWRSLQSGQYCLYLEKDTLKPLGFCNWLWVSEKILGELLSGEREVQMDDWHSGDIPFFPELIAPYGDLRRIARDMRNEVFGNVPWGYSLRANKSAPDSAAWPERRVFKWKLNGSIDTEGQGHGDRDTHNPIRHL